MPVLAVRASSSPCSAFPSFTCHGVQSMVLGSCEACLHHGARLTETCRGPGCRFLGRVGEPARRFFYERGFPFRFDSGSSRRLIPRGLLRGSLPVMMDPDDAGSTSMRYGSCFRRETSQQRSPSAMMVNQADPIGVRRIPTSCAIRVLNNLPLQSPSTKLCLGKVIESNV